LKPRGNQYVKDMLHNVSTEEATGAKDEGSSGSSGAEDDVPF
jgi:hypothetical protein